MYTILTNISLLAICLFIPFAVVSFLHGRFNIGIGTTVITLLFALNIWAVKNPKKLDPQKVLFGLVPVFVVCLSYSIYTQKIIGVLWCYPAIVSSYFFLPQKKARLANAAILLFTFPVIWQLFELPLIVRIYLTIIIVSILAAVFMKLTNEQQLKLQNSASTDFLTGALNRTLLKKHIEEAIEQNRRINLPMTLVALDLDHFKKVNDKYGHIQGDEVLKDVAALLIERCRKIDKIFRLGGEEFLVLLYNTNLKNAINIAEELRLSISESRILPQEKITVSLGISTIQENENYLNWIKRADEKLYLAKDNGRNRIEY